MWKKVAIGVIAAGAIYYFAKKYSKQEIVVPVTPDLRPKFKGSWMVLDDNRSLRNSLLEGKTLLAPAAYGLDQVQAWLAKIGLPPVTPEMQDTAVKHIHSFAGENLQAEPTFNLYQKVGKTDFFLCAKSVLGSTGEEIGGIPAENLEDVNLWFYLYAEAV
jgi:hypothetical protein